MNNCNCPLCYWLTVAIQFIYGNNDGSVRGLKWNLTGHKSYCNFQERIFYWQRFCEIINWCYYHQRMPVQYKEHKTLYVIILYYWLATCYCWNFMDNEVWYLLLYRLSNSSNTKTISLFAKSCCFFSRNGSN